MQFRLETPSRLEPVIRTRTAVRAIGGLPAAAACALGLEYLFVFFLQSGEVLVYMLNKI
jgi:hypothetical protein